MALADPWPKPPLCGICACPMPMPEPETDPFLKDLRKSLLDNACLWSICAKCAPDRDALDRLSRVAKAAHGVGVKDERDRIRDFLRDFLPPREPSLHELKF